MRITNHILEEAEQFSTKKTGGIISPKFAALHLSEKSLDDLLFDFTENADTKESAHVIFSEDRIIQLVPFNVKAWHAGASYWQGYHGLNGFSVGVYLLDNADEDALHAFLPELVATYNLRDIINIPRPGCLPYDVTPYKPYVDYGNADSLGRYVTVNTTFTREGPDARFQSMDTIRAGEAVKVLRKSRDEEWLFIYYERDDHTPRQGWVYETNLRRL